jgi:murein lipoprotein
MIRKYGYVLLCLVLSIFLAATLISCATCQHSKTLENQVQQALQEAQAAKALAQDCVQKTSADAQRAENAADRAEKAADDAEASAQKAEDMANKAEAIFNKTMQK